MTLCTRYLQQAVNYKYLMGLDYKYWNSSYETHRAVKLFRTLNTAVNLFVVYGTS